MRALPSWSFRWISKHFSRRQQAKHLAGAGGGVYKRQHSLVLTNRSHSMANRQRLTRFLVALLVVTAAAAFSLATGTSGPAGEARLVAFEALPDYSSETCEWEVALPTPQAMSYAPAGVAAAQLPDGNARMAAAARQPLRFIQ